MIANVTTIQLALVTQTGHSTAALTLTKRGDGSYEFTGTNGLPVRAHSNEEMRELFDAAAALV